MIEKSRVIPMLFEADPDFLPAWDAHLADWADWEPDAATVYTIEDVGEEEWLEQQENPRGYYNDLHAFADHVWERYCAGRTDAFAAIFAVCEWILVNSENDPRDDPISNLITIGFFESLQHEIERLQERDRLTPTVWDREAFTQWLGPVSYANWVSAGGHTGLYNHAIWEEYAPPRSALIALGVANPEAVRLVATDCRIRDRGLQGRALLDVGTTPHERYVVWLVANERHAVVAISPVEARHAYEHLEHAVLRLHEAFPEGLATRVASSARMEGLSHDWIERLRHVVRGERPWTDVEAAPPPLRRQVTEVGWYLSVTQWPVQAVEVTGSDVLAGFRVYQSDPQALQAWAFLLWASAAFVVRPSTILDSFEANHEHLDVRIGLWDAAFGEPLKSGLLARLESVPPHSGDRA